MLFAFCFLQAFAAGSSLAASQIPIQFAATQGAMMVPSLVATRGVLIQPYNLYAHSFIENGVMSGSDRRWKKDIIPLASALERVRKLQPVTFHWRVHEYPKVQFDERTHVGFIAQDVRRLFPEAVTVGDDGYLSLDYGAMTAPLVGAIQALDQENRRLQSQIQNLQMQIELLAVAIKNK